MVLPTMGELIAEDGIGVGVKIVGVTPIQTCGIGKTVVAIQIRGIGKIVTVIQVRGIGETVAAIQVPGIGEVLIREVGTQVDLMVVQIAAHGEVTKCLAA